MLLWRQGWYSIGSNPHPRRLRPAAVSYQVGDPQVFQIDGVVGSHQRERGLVVKVAPLPPDFLMLSGYETRRHLPAFAPFLPTREPLLRFGELLRGLAGVARILDHRALRRDEKHLQPHINTRLSACARQGQNGHPGAGEADIRTVCLAAEGDGLRGVSKRVRPAHRDVVDFGEHQDAVVQAGAIANLLVGERVVAIRPWKRG